MQDERSGGPIQVFGPTPEKGPEAPPVFDPDTLWMRELAERRAAKRSCTTAARRVHQELAELYAALRRNGKSQSR
jgi:hypothetical protein